MNPSLAVAAAALLWLSAVALYIWHSARPLIERRLQISESRAEIERMAVLRPAVKDEDPMPKDMVEWAMAESFDWAREDKLTRMRELYAKLQNWDKVRGAMMTEEDDSLKQTF